MVEGEVPVRESGRTPLQTFRDPEDVKKVSSLATPASVVGVFAYLDVPLEELLLSREKVVLLVGVQDPGNVGTVVRSARAFGAGVALSEGSADLYNPKTVRGTMGAIFHSPVSREVDPKKVLRRAKEGGFSTVAAVAHGGAPPRKMPAGKVVVAVGAEGSGLPEEVIEACDLAVSIPSLAPSLNAGVAASILLYEAHSRVLP